MQLDAFCEGYKNKKFEKSEKKREIIIGMIGGTNKGDVGMRG
jgi:hypothetical protein